MTLLEDRALISQNNRDRTLELKCGDSRIHFDRSGRLVYAVEPKRVIRRGLDSRLLEVKLFGDNQAALRSYRDIQEPEKSAWLNQVYQYARNADVAGLPTETLNKWERAMSWNAKKLADDEDAFLDVYKPVSILPPSEYHSLVVQITEGCSYNRCVFCDFYRDRPFHIKREAELRLHLLGISNFMGSRVKDRTNVFLGDGNALAAPTWGILSALSDIRDHLGPVADSAATFMDTFTIEHKTDDELRALRASNLDTLYVGLETGSDSLRSWLRKPGTAEKALTAINRCKDAGFRLGVMVLVGVGGREVANEHLRDTTNLLRQAKFSADDIIYLSPFVEPEHAGYRETMDVLGLTSFSGPELVTETNRWKGKLSHLTPAQVSFYFIREHIY